MCGYYMHIVCIACGMGAGNSALDEGCAGKH